VADTWQSRRLVQHFLTGDHGKVKIDIRQTCPLKAAAPALSGLAVRKTTDLNTNIP